MARAGAQGRPGEPPLVAERVLPPALPRDPDQLAPLVAEALASDALAPRWGDRQCFGGRSATSPF